MRGQRSYSRWLPCLCRESCWWRRGRDRTVQVGRVEERFETVTRERQLRGGKGSCKKPAGGRDLRGRDSCGYNVQGAVSAYQKCGMVRDAAKRNGSYAGAAMRKIYRAAGAA